MGTVGKGLANVALALAAIGVTLLTLEQAYRMYLFGWDSLSPAKMNSLHGFGVSGLVQPSPHDDLAFELRPNLETLFKRVTFVTNSRGERDQEYSLEKPPSTFRIALVGDSFSMPSGVRIEDAYHSVLEENLNSTPEGASFEVINLAVAGYNLRQYWGVIKAKAQPYSPDLVIIGFCAHNDHRAWRDIWFERPYEVRPVERAFFSSFLLSGIQLRRGLALKTDGERTEKAKFVKVGDNKKRVKDYLSRIGVWSRQQSVPIAIAYLSTVPMRSPFLERAFAREGFSFVNLTLEFLDTDPSEYFLNPFGLSSEQRGAPRLR